MSVYLSEDDQARLARVAKDRGTSQSEVIRDALVVLERTQRPDRNFAMAGVVQGTGISASEISEEELLEGFGDDSDRR